MTSAVWWVRRDLRLSHNAALSAALESCQAVIPVFVLDDQLLRHAAPKRHAFLFEGLRALDSDLRARGSRLVVRRGDPRMALPAFLQESGAQAVFAAEDFSPYARRRDAEIARRLPLHLSGGVTVFPPQAVLKGDGSPYRVFTPYSRAWKALPLSMDPAAVKIPPFPAMPAYPSYPIPASEALADFPAGEEEAQRRLEAFLSGPIFEYAEGRNRLDLPGTSALSPYLHFGMLSPRQAAAATLRAARSADEPAARRGAETWLNELIWREFYNSILYHFPDVLRGAFNPKLRHIAWRDDPHSLHAWQAGLTGIPVADAAMRQMAATGWMHNRARMIAASFLVKNLLIDWQAGEAWFMRSLVDGDLAANNGGWQWTAGVGTDAAPYFRIFNPVLQGRKFDPYGNYVRRWVPELANVPLRYLQSPWEMPAALQKDCGCRIGIDYPAPLVDLSSTKERTLAAYRRSQAPHPPLPGI